MMCYFPISPDQKVWLVLQPFETILGCIKDIQNLMEKLITWPRDCGKAIVDGSSNFPAPC